VKFKKLGFSAPFKCLFQGKTLGPSSLHIVVTQADKRHADKLFCAGLRQHPRHICNVTITQETLRCHFNELA